MQLNTHDSGWNAPEQLSIPNSDAKYFLVSLTFHHSKKVLDTSNPYPESGHFTSWLQHIDGSTVLAYNDLVSNGTIAPVSQRSQEMFYQGIYRSKREPLYAVYYLMGGEATQDLLYQQQLSYISNKFGINITHSGSISNSLDRWPTSISLSSSLPGLFGRLSHAQVQKHFSISSSYNFRAESSRAIYPLDQK